MSGATWEEGTILPEQLQPWEDVSPLRYSNGIPCPAGLGPPDTSQVASRNERSMEAGYFGQWWHAFPSLARGASLKHGP